MDKKQTTLAVRCATAIKTLRKTLGLSQADFGAQIGVTPRTIARWEAGQLIPASNLSLLEREAAKQGRRDLQKIFREGMGATLGSWDTSDLDLDLTARTNRERLLVSIILAMDRNPTYHKDLIAMVPHMRRAAAGCIQALDDHRQQKKTVDEAIRFLDAGVAEAAIAKLLEIDETVVRKIQLATSLRRSFEALKESK